MWYRVEATNILMPEDPPLRDDDFFSIGIGFTEMADAAACAQGHLSAHFAPAPLLTFVRSPCKSSGRVFTAHHDKMIAFRITEHAA